MKVIGNPVRINSRIHCQLIDKAVHIIGFIIDGSDIFVHFFRRIRHAVHNPFHIAFDGRDGRLQIMGNVADKLLVLLLCKNLFIGGLLQAQPHIFIIPVKLANLPVLLFRKHIFQIALRNILHGDIKLVNRNENASANPVCQEHTCKDKDYHNGNRHIHKQPPRQDGIHSANHKKASLSTVGKVKIHLPYQLFHIVKINAFLQFLIEYFPLELRQSVKNLFCRQFVSRIINLIIFAHNNIGRFIFNLFVNIRKHVNIFQPRFIFPQYFFCLLKYFPGNEPRGMRRVNEHVVVLIAESVFLLLMDKRAADAQKRRAGKH